MSQRIRAKYSKAKLSIGVFRNVNLLRKWVTHGRSQEKQVKIFPSGAQTGQKIDVEKLQFGSKIDAESEGKRDEYFTVKEIINPELVKFKRKSRDCCKAGRLKSGSTEIADKEIAL
jgi:hypothetical protein